jgi:uncharacterized Zn finger protein (UPF0148 family)
MMSLYQCVNCGEQYVVEHGTIRCPYCESKEREPQGEFTLEDVNNLLVERRELQQALKESR